MINYGVVIVTYNRLNLLKECIEAVETQTMKPSKIVIVNNNSTDGTAEFLKEKESENFIVETVTSNEGSSYGFSRGVEILRDLDVDWQLIIDDDAIIDKDYVLNISKYIKEEYKAYSGTVVENDKIALLHRCRIKGNTKRVIVSEEEYKNNTFEYEISSFCGLLVKNEIVKKMELPRRELFTQYTDTEYSIRLREFTKVLNINSAKLTHKVNPKGKMKTWKIYYTIRNSIYIYKILSKKQLIVKTYVFIFLKYTKQCLKYLLKSIFYDRKYNFEAIHATIHGMYDGLKEKLGKNEKFLPGLKL